MILLWDSISNESVPDDWLHLAEGELQLSFMEHSTGGNPGGRPRSRCRFCFGPRIVKGHVHAAKIALRIR